VFSSTGAELAWNGIRWWFRELKLICGFKVGFAQNKFGEILHISNDARILFNIQKFPVLI